MDAKHLKVANNSLKKALSYALEKGWSRSFAHFLVFLELLPDKRDTYETIFADVLHEFGLHLEKQDNLEDLLKSYMKALRYYPYNVGILNNLGSHLVRMEQPDIALSYLERAVEYNPYFLLAEKNLQTAKLNLIPRWHFRMLNDCKRNIAYKTAIHKAVSSQYNKVLDIGAGCGLLSYYASTCPAIQSITAIESSPTLALIAMKALQHVKIAEVINKKSTDLTSAEIDLSNLLITEIFDTGLVGEHVLRTLVHAWENLLEPMAKIIPYSADLFVTGISNESIVSKNKVFNNKIPQLNLGNVCIRQFNPEPYEAEDLTQKSVKYITNTQLAVNINFNDYPQIKNIYTNYNAIEEFKLKCINAGTIHALAVWFNLNLDEETTITTNPLGDTVNCWEQALVYLQHPLTLQENEEITLKLSCVADRLVMEVLDSPSTCTCTACFEILPEMITFLNDTQVVEAAEDLELPSMFNEKSCQILDLNPVPLFALFRAKKGFPGHYQCSGIGAEDIKFLEFLWRSNGICPIEEATSETKITFKIFSWLEVYEQMTVNSLDVIFINPVSQNGILCEQTFNRIPNLVGILKPDGVILPRQVTLDIELIDSKYLDSCHKVDDENLLGLSIASEMNKYSILEQWQVQPQYYQRKTMCNLATKTNVLTNGFPEKYSSHNITVPIAGTANGVLYWYKFVFSENVSINTYKSDYYNGACFIFKNPRRINSGDRMAIIVQQDKGLLKISGGQVGYED